MDRGDQLGAVEVALKSDATRCPDCGTRTGVYRTRGHKRHRKCPNCGRRYSTQEVHQVHIDQALGMVDVALEILEESADE